MRSRGDPERDPEAGTSRPSSNRSNGIRARSYSRPITWMIRIDLVRCSVRGPFPSAPANSSPLVWTRCTSGRPIAICLTPSTAPAGAPIRQHLDEEDDLTMGRL